MLIKMICPQCNAELLIDGRYAGKSGRCKKCQSRITVPDLASDVQRGVRQGDATDSKSKPSRTRRSSLIRISIESAVILLVCSILIVLWVRSGGQREEDRIVLNNGQNVNPTAPYVNDSPVIQKAEEEPLVGQWLWFNGQNVTFENNGTLTNNEGGQGIWRSLEVTPLETYVIEWDGGVWVDTLTLSEDARKLSGTNQNDVNVSGDRIVFNEGQIVNPVARGNDPRSIRNAEKDPLVGQWSWFNGVNVTIQNNGTLTNNLGGQGTWRRLAVAPLKKYEIEWDGGVWVDTLTLSKDARKLSGTNQDNVKVTADFIVFNEGQIVNPVAPYGNDPWVVQKNGLYYYCYSIAGSIWINVDRTLQGAVQFRGMKVWTPERYRPYSEDLWAPELHFLRGRWYIYFAADDGRNENHRMYVLESESRDPLGNYTFSGKISDPSDKWAIDGTVLEHAGRLYFIWSGWAGERNVQQNLYIAQMKDPKTIVGARVLISRPQHYWEKIDRPLINEGPEVLKHQGEVFIIYSASGSWSNDYCLGQLKLTGNNPLNPRSWPKSRTPVFMGTGKVFSPGHASFVKSPDGTEDWIVYHTAKYKGAGWNRDVNIKRFTWDIHGNPNFGRPEKFAGFPAPSE